MKKILLTYSLHEEVAATIAMLYKNTKAPVWSAKIDKNFDLTISVLQGNTTVP